MQRTVTVTFPEGLHARPAALFVAEAAKQPASVTIARPGGTPVAAASILAVLTLGVKVGETIVLTTADDDEAATASLDALDAFLLRTDVV